MIDLDKLIAAVEAGDEDEASSLCRMMNRDAHDAGTFWPAHDVAKAYRGSLDAAHRLHTALLTGWHIQIAQPESFAQGDDFTVSVQCPDYSKRESFYRPTATSPNPARAWLLAILRATAASRATVDTQTGGEG